MSGTDLVLTRHEVTVLADYAASQSKVRTYRLVRDTSNVLYVLNPDGRLYRLTPIIYRRPLSRKENEG